MSTRRFLNALASLALGVPLWTASLVGVSLPSLAAQAQVETDIESWVRKAESLLAQEKSQPALRSQRVAAFSESARLLAQRLETIPEQSGAYPVQLFRIGLYLYLSEAPADAQIILTECQRHPQLHSPQAVWKGQPIATHLRTFTGVRIFATSDQGSSPSVSEGAVEGGMRLWAHSSKGSIRPAKTPTTETPFSPEEQRLLRARIGQTRFAQAAQQLATSLLKPLGTPVTAVDERIVVAALGQKDDADQLAKELSRIQQRLWTKFFERRDPPPLLVVYANLGPGYDEDSARSLSMAVHGRPSAEREGYYSPLDRSLVLRKGIAGDSGRLFLGTAIHELAHALIDVDAPQTPHWLNEGMAALLEEQDIVGQPIDNYRLYDLLLAQKQSQPVSVRSVVAGQAPADPRLRDAMSRYIILWVYTQRGEGALRKLYGSLRKSPKQAAQPLLATVFGVPAAQLDDKFQEFLKSRNMADLDQRWGAIKPVELAAPTDSIHPAGPSRLKGEGSGQMMQMQQRQQGPSPQLLQRFQQLQPQQQLQQQQRQ